MFGLTLCLTFCQKPHWTKLLNKQLLDLIVPNILSILQIFSTLVHSIVRRHYTGIEQYLYIHIFPKFVHVHSSIAFSLKQNDDCEYKYLSTILFGWLHYFLTPTVLKITLAYTYYIVKLQNQIKTTYIYFLFHFTTAIDLKMFCLLYLQNSCF